MRNGLSACPTLQPAATHLGCERFNSNRAKIFAICYLLFGLKGRANYECLHQSQSSGDSFFVPGLVQLDKIRTIVESVDLPLNVLATRGVATIPEIEKTGAKRLSVGARLTEAVFGRLNQLATELLHGHSSRSLCREPYLCGNSRVLAGLYRPTRSCQIIHLVQSGCLGPKPSAIPLLAEYKHGCTDCGL